MQLIVVSASARFVVESALRSGFSVSAVDLFADWDFEHLRSQFSDSLMTVKKLNCFDELDLNSLTDFVSTEKTDHHGVVIGGGLENRLEIVRDIERDFILLGPSSESLQRLHQIEFLKTIRSEIETSGGRLPESRYLNEIANIDDDWLIKDLAGAGGGHVLPLNSENLSRCCELPNTCVVQKKIEGQSISAAYVANEHRCELLGATRQLLGQQPFGGSPYSYCGSIGPIDIAADLLSALQQTGETIAEQANLIGLFGIDLISNVDGAWIIDVNPRIPASSEIFEYLDHPVSISRLHVAACRGEHPTSWCCFENEQPIFRDFHNVHTDNNVRRSLIGKAILFSWRPDNWIFNEACLEAMIRWFQVDRSRSERWVADIPTPGTRLEFGQPVLSIFIRAHSVDSAHTELASFAWDLRSTLDHEMGQIDPIS